MSPSLSLTGSAGRLDALLDEPSGTPRAAAVFAHPHPLHGGTMHTKVIYQGAKALTRIGCAVLRFNFRGVGTSAGAFDEGRGELADYRMALDHMAGRYPAVPLWTAGFSFGAWIALTAGAGDPRVTALVGIAPAIERYDFSAVERSGTAKFFIQGDRDEICPLGRLRAFYATLPEPKDLVVIEGADHVFDGKVGEVAEALEDLLADWS